VANIFEYTGRYPGKYDFMDCCGPRNSTRLWVLARRHGLAKTTALSRPFRGGGGGLFRYSSTNTRAITTTPTPPQPAGRLFFLQWRQRQRSPIQSGYNNATAMTGSLLAAPRSPDMLQDAIGCQNQPCRSERQPEVIVLTRWDNNPIPTTLSQTSVSGNGADTNTCGP